MLQVEAHHFCACPNAEVRQCVIYDSDRADARLIGLEYIISAALFEQLPEEEKVYWHSHKYEVQSGTLQVSLLWQMQHARTACAFLNEAVTLMILTCNTGAGVTYVCSTNSHEPCKLVLTSMSSICTAYHLQFLVCFPVGLLHLRFRVQGNLSCRLV